VIGGIGEILGWAGRLWAAKNPNSHDGFLIQIVCLIIAPCFFSAMLYGTTGKLIRLIGPEYSSLGSVASVHPSGSGAARGSAADDDRVARWTGRLGFCASSARLTLSRSSFRPPVEEWPPVSRPFL